MTEWIGLLGLQGQSKSISSFDLGVKTGDGLGPTLGKLLLNCHQDSKFRKYKMPTFLHQIPSSIDSIANIQKGRKHQNRKLCNEIVANSKVYFRYLENVFLLRLHLFLLFVQFSNLFFFLKEVNYLKYVWQNYLPRLFSCPT